MCEIQSVIFEDKQKQLFCMVLFFKRQLNSRDPNTGEV